MSTAGFSGSDPSKLRIGDAERNSAMDALGEHLSSGRIDLDEFGTRSAQVSQARTVGDLRELFVDLPAPHPTLPGPPAPAADRLPVGRPAAPPARQDDPRTPAQRMASFALAASGILAAVLFFALHLPWYIFLLPAVVGVLTSAAWGGDWKDGNRRR
ncbi:DUF1707 SHOCT-like domain-containing protein [Nakamurella sp. GG22]